MHSTVARAGLASLLALTVACRSSPDTGSGAGTPPPVACSVNVPGADLTGWREVRTDHFSFCVPGGWTVQQRTRIVFDKRTWVGWGRDADPLQGGVLPRTQAIGVNGRRPMITVRPDSGQRFEVTIDGQPATLVVRQVRTAFFTTLEMGPDRAILGGEARTAEEAELQLVIFHTVRFTAR